MQGLIQELRALQAEVDALLARMAGIADAMARVQAQGSTETMAALWEAAREGGEA